jgi:hypothetical protein
MARSLTNLAAMFLRDKHAFRAALTSPVLIWKAPPTDASAERWQGTHPGVGPARPHEGQAVVFDVTKDPSKQNAFAMGVTVGRIDTNDIPVDDVSVSRFHAWLAQDGKGWVLCDAESKNGTFLDGKRLEAKQKPVIHDNAKLKFGEVEVTFFTVDALIAMMEAMMRK